MDIESSENQSNLIAAIILLAALSLYILLDLAISASLNLIISGGFALFVLALTLYILQPVPLKQKLLLTGLIVTAVFSLRFVDWNGRKQFLHDFYQIQPGMTAEEVDSVMAEYDKNISPFVNHSFHGDIQTGTITYLPTAETRENAHLASITFAGGRVVASTYYSD
ncbi:MAG: hypothetical protein GWN30_07580 [Gammaproteobacteria bacterium]|nr:hypothetical protein [Gammaproteobacteria bacterium]